jgi:hypothetical protein
MKDLRGIITTMRNQRTAALLGVLAGSLVLLSTSWAFALVTEPDLAVTIGGQTTTLAGEEWNYNPDLDTYTLAGPVLARNNLGALVIKDAYAIPDPVLFFSASATNPTANPLTYTVAFSTPLTPNLLGLVDSHAELGVTLTDGLNDGATVQPAVLGGKMLTSFDLYADGASLSKNVDIGNLYSIVSGVSNTTFSSDSSLVCGQACVTMSAVLSFTLTGKDAAAFSGKVVQVQNSDVQPVPLPAAVWLFGSGLAGVVALARRRMSL